MAGDTKSYHQFVVSNDAGLVIRCCIHCGLSHRMEAYQERQTRQRAWGWKLILEEKEDKTFSEPCAVENGSDDLFPYHHFIVSNYHRPREWDAVVIRFCVRCGLSHRLSWDTPFILSSNRGIEVPNPGDTHTRIPNWQCVKENERDLTVSGMCPVEQESDTSKQRYLLILKN